MLASAREWLGLPASPIERPAIPSTRHGPSGGAPGWVRLTRSGSTVSAYHSTNGTSWTLVGTDTIALSNTVYVGLARDVSQRQRTGDRGFLQCRGTAALVDEQPAANGVRSAVRPTVHLTRRPASITINAAASDSDGTITRVDFYAGGTLLGSDTSSPYSFNWTGVAAGTYSLTAVARDDDGASTTSAAGYRHGAPAAALNSDDRWCSHPSPDHASLVSSYSVALYRSGDPVTATPVATKNLGKPSPVNNEISASITDIVNPLPAGSYYAVVTAIGSGGSAQSSPSAPFTK